MTTARIGAEAAVGRGLTKGKVTVLAVLVLLAAGATVAFGAPDVRFLVAGATAMALGVLGIALLFSYRYTLYIPATFGRRRLFEYAPIPLMLLALAVLQVAASRIALRWATVGRAVALVSVLAVALATVGDLGAVAKSDSPRYLTAAVTTPCDSRLLIDRDTRGTFQALTGRISITEGLLPFLRPTIVNDVLRLREATDQFFADPQRSARILDEQEVDFVIARVNPALDEAEALTLTDSVDGLGVYAVEGGASARLLPRPTESAGYHCFTEVPG